MVTLAYQTQKIPNRHVFKPTDTIGHSIYLTTWASGHQLFLRYVIRVGVRKKAGTEKIPRKLKRCPARPTDKERARLIEKICKAGGRVVAPSN